MRRLVAETRPANATDPFDPTYRFDDLGEGAVEIQARLDAVADRRPA